MESPKCLIVGSGLMVRSLISTLFPLGYNITVTGNVQSELDSLSSEFGISTVFADACQEGALNPLVQGMTVVISMIPPRFHHRVLQACIASKVNLVTPSYVSPDMYSLEQAAKDAGIVVSNENGLDPGIDHMSVIKKLEEIRSKGGKVEEFQSSCGAFPAPEACTNKLCYKLAWAPYGALLAATRPAKFLKLNEVVEISGCELMGTQKPYNLAFPLPITFYPNGDSLVYPKKYGIEEAHTVMRCTLRYKNYPIICQALCVLGIYNESPREFTENFTWIELLEELAGSEERALDNMPEFFTETLSRKLSTKFQNLPQENISLIFEAFHELGLSSNAPVVGNSVFAAYVNQVQGLLEYKEGERDCVIMEHLFKVRYEDKVVRCKSRLIDYGVPNGGTSAVSRLVSVPTALAADWVCKNDHAPGFMFPMESKFASDVLKKLEEEYNVKFEEEEEIIG